LGFLIKNLSKKGAVGAGKVFEASRPSERECRAVYSFRQLHFEGNTQTGYSIEMQG
jgi:hypothetical protein